MISKLDKSIISLISRDIPLVKEPFKGLARTLGIGERELLRRMRSYRKRGLMRKFSAALNHKKIGIRYNAMVVWDVPEELIERAGALMASHEEVSHCYRRVRRPGWDYNLYSMIHGRAKGECLAVVGKIQKELGGAIRHKALFSTKEEKKTGAKL